MATRPQKKQPSAKHFHKLAKSEIDNLIKAEITKSGLQIGSGFHKALKSYTSNFKIKGKDAEKVKVYLAATALGIAKNDKGLFSGGIKPKFVFPRHVLAAVYGFHLPKSPFDPCIEATHQILRIEGKRSKGNKGILSPALSEYLDTFKEAGA